MMTPLHPPSSSILLLLKFSTILSTPDTYLLYLTTSQSPAAPPTQDLVRWPCGISHPIGQHVERRPPHIVPALEAMTRVPCTISPTLATTNHSTQFSPLPSSPVHVLQSHAGQTAGIVPQSPPLCRPELLTDNFPLFC